MNRLLVIDMSKLEEDIQTPSCQGGRLLDVVVDGENER